MSGATEADKAAAIRIAELERENARLKGWIEELTVRVAVAECAAEEMAEKRWSS